MSGELSTHTIIIPDNKSDLQEEHATLVEKETQFLRENLSDLRIDSDNEYGILEGTEERREEFIEQFTALNSTCFVRSKTSVKGTDPEGSKESGSSNTSENGTNDIMIF